MSTRFVADVGGTNIRLATETDGKLSAIKKYLCNDFATIGEAIKTYFAEFPQLTFSAGCIAIACPVPGDQVKMTNHYWEFSIEALKQELSLEWLGVINDFTSVAHSIPALEGRAEVTDWWWRGRK